MANSRNEDQKVDAFSAPKALLRLAGQEALRRGFTKSGFYRFCLAKECGFSEPEAVQFAEHGSIARCREKLTAQVSVESVALNESPTAYRVTEPPAAAAPKPPAKPSRKTPQNPTL